MFGTIFFLTTQECNNSILKIVSILSSDPSLPIAQLFENSYTYINLLLGHLA